MFQYNSNEKRAKKICSRLNIECWKIDLSAEFTLPIRDFDVVVNNAAINISDAATADVSAEEWDKTLHINLYAPFRIIKECLPGMIKRRWGRIINVSSIYGLRASEGNLAYTVSKHGLNGLSKTVAKEYARHGITCNEICPGPIKSELMHRIAKRETSGTKTSISDFLKSLAEEIPAGRFASPKEVARVALFLASDDAAYINGASLPLDGGDIA